ncbi:BTAD domain-containing putative transcriptional regulator [Streptomyces sp. NPDC059740]|uniref:AfsR/SARP family transcriptional regulator n=1 Tax=Streptomyces sp. NPDC059740 TaxID=3346926 RepID=UPI0036555E24
MRYAILGTTRALRADGTSVAVGGRRLRALLAALALRPGRTFAPAVLIADVWGAQPPRDAPGALQALVGRLRRALGPAAVASSHGGYRLVADADDVDLHRFERLTREGTEALAAGDPAKAAAVLEEGLALWRGAAVADLPEAHAEAARADARRLDAQRALHTCHLELGLAEHALPALTGLCEDHPLDEPLQALRIRALRDAGRPAEALASYDAVRRDLADRLGADPGPALRALHAELLAPPPGGEQPAVPAPHHPDPATARPGAAAPPAPARRPGPARSGGNLRARPTSFVGREDDLAALRAGLATHRLVTLLGPGGAGKTRLSQEAAEQAVAADPESWPHGVWLAELAPLADPGTVPEAVLTALGGRETVVRGTTAEGLRAATDPTGGEPTARLVEHCAGRRMLLVLDNCEHVLDAVAELAGRLLAECPGVTVLATSREPLAVPGEVLHPVGPLPDPVALRLFQERGAAARPGFTVAEDPAACAEVCRRLDGLPLAVELAAARLRVLGPRQLADRLDDRFRLLTSGSRTALPRQQTLRAVVDWSWELLTEPEKAVLRRLAVFAGGCEPAAAEEVCADPAGTRSAAVSSRDVAALLGSLVDKSLVVATPGPGGRMRYRLLETVAEYAGERLDEAGERAAAEHRHLVHHRELVRRNEGLLRGPRQREWLDRLEEEHENLRAALRRAVAAEDEHEALSLVLSLHWFWTLRDHRGDGRTWAQAAAALGPSPFLPPATPAEPLYDRPIDAPPPLPPEQLVEARRQVRVLALAAYDHDAPFLRSEEGRAEVEGVVTAYRSGLPQTCRLPGALWFFALMVSDRAADVRRQADETVAACRAHGYEWELAMSLQLRAKLLNDHPEAGERAAADSDEALEIFERLGDAWGAAEALGGRGEARLVRGEYELAAEDYRAAMRYAEALGAHGQVPVLKAQLAGVLVEGDEAERGVAMLREVIAAGEGDRGEAIAFARMTLARRLSVTGETAEAREQLLLVREEFGQSTVPVLFWGLLDSALVGVEVEAGNRAPELLPRMRTAVAALREPLAAVIAPDLPITQLVVAARAVLAVDGARRAADAARLVGAFDALWFLGRRPFRDIRHARAAAEREARALLDGAAWEQAYAEGGGLSLSEATALI